MCDGDATRIFVKLSTTLSISVDRSGTVPSIYATKVN
jgi:hypothetical protein